MKKTMRLSAHLRQMEYKDYQALYNDWVKNFSSIEEFADHHGIEFSMAVSLINNASWLYENADTIEETFKRR